MPYISELLGAAVRDPDGRTVGRVADLLVASDADFPLVDALTVRTDQGETRTIAWPAVRALGGAGLSLNAPLSELPPFEPPQPELSLARQVLDHQIIDINGVRVVRVNDLQLAATDGTFRLVGADVSTAGLLRRLGAGKLLGRLGIHPTPRTIAWSEVEPVDSGATGVRLKVPHEDLARLHPSDVAEIISQLDRQHGQEVIEQLDDEAAADAIQEVSPELQRDLIRGLDAERAADILEEMDPDEAADILGDLEPEQAQDLLSRMDSDEAEDVRELLTYSDKCAGGLMTTDLVTLPAEVTAGQAIALVREQAAAIENVHDIYVVDRAERLLGALSLRDLVVADPAAPIATVMRRDIIRGRPDDSQEEVAHRIAKYNLLALPIVDEEERLKGIVTVDDAMDVLLPEDWKARVPRVFRGQ